MGEWANIVASFKEMIVVGVPTSLIITVSGLLIGFVLAVVISVVRTLWGRSPFGLLAKYFVIFFTGTPLLVQLFLIYYGPGQFAFIRETFLWSAFGSAWFCGILTLGLNSAAYSSQLFYGALQNISKMEWNACLALGMNKREAFTPLFSLALRRALPTYSNEIVLVFKSTSLVSVITLLDIVGVAQQWTGRTYDQFTYFVVAGVIYLFFNGILIFLAKSLEKRALAFET